MRLTAFFMLVACLQVSARGYSQISLRVKDAPLSTVLEELRHQSALPIVYTEQMLAPAHRVTIELTNVPLERALDLLLKDQPLTWSILEGTVVLRPKPEAVAPVLPPAAGANNDIHGRVTDSLGNPLVGASVTVKGSKRGTATNEKGEFDLKGIGDGATLVISFSGYEARQINVHGKDSWQIVLSRSNSQLDQVQVIAYGTTTERYATGDVTTITSKDIEEQPVSNVLAAIEGRVPGLLITQYSGMPGSSFAVQIRGQNSITNGNDPFYVIDGVPYTSELIPGLNPAGGSPLNFLNPSDIESVSVLKDADATAIYGSRAANGAILITTKKGKAGKARFDINVYQGAGSAPFKVQWLNTPQYLQMRHEALNNDGVAPSLANGDNDLLLWDTTRYTNWQKLLIGGTAKYTDVQANLSGGNINTQYQFGGAYHRESTVFPFYGADQKVSVHFNLTTTSDDQRFRAVLTGNYMVDNSNLPAGDLTQLLNTPPDAPPIYNSDGSLNWANGTWPNGNPLSATLQKYTAQTNNLVSNAVLSYHLTKGLDIKSNFGYTNMQANEMATYPIAAQNPAYSPTGFSGFTNNNIHSWIVEPQATYQLKSGQNGVEALVGSTFNENTSSGQQLSASGYTSDALLEDAQAAPTLHVTVTSVVYKYNALFGRLNYNYDDKYLLNLNWRRDGSSRFGPDNEFHNFASVGGAWIFTKEDFIKTALPFLSFGKLRGSYGTTGNDQIGDYKFYNLFQTSYYSYQGTTGLTPTGLYNPNLEWELTKKFEGAIELGVVKDRIIFRGSYYHNRSSNQLLSDPLPAITGFGSISVNLPATVQNSGWEFTLNTTNIKTRTFGWKSAFNLTMNRNKIIAFPGLATNSSYQYSYFIGQPLGAEKVFHCAGVDPETGVYEFSDSAAKPTDNPSYITDRTVFVNTLPRFYGGFQNTFNFKGWQLDLFFQFRKQLGTNYFLQPSFPPGIEGKNEPVGVLDRWQIPGDKKPIEQFTQSFGSNAFAAYSYAQTSDYYYVNTSFIRLSNLSLSYQLSGNWTQRIHLKDFRIYLHGQNLLTLTRYKGMDPENQSISSLPPLRVLTGGVQLSL
jgi:TonB-linked SusC/RagA family outer membrane protein